MAPFTAAAGFWETATARSWNSLSASIVDADMRDLHPLDDAPLFFPSIWHNT